MDPRPIGIFDSGLGGLTAAAALMALLPGEDLVYFGDSANAPYGTRSREELLSLATANAAFLQSFDVKAILVACGTVSSTVIGQVRQRCAVPMFDVVEAPCRAFARSGGRRAAVAATEATIRSGAFELALREACPGREVYSAACPAFVPLIESGRVGRDDPKLQRAVEYYLQPLKEHGVGTLLLGCTHYGLIEGALRDYLGEDVRLIDASACAAAFILEYLEENDLRGGEGSLLCLTSGEKERFEQLAPLFLGQEDPPRTEQVPVMPAEEEA
jgi:glutamate racemase